MFQQSIQLLQCFFFLFQISQRTADYLTVIAVSARLDGILYKLIEVLAQ